MGIIGRLLLFLYVLAVLAALVVSAGVCLHLIPSQLWQDALKEIISRQETLAVIGAMSVASLCLLCMVFSGKKTSVEHDSGDIELQKGQAGEVFVAVEAVTSVVERAALTVSGVREVHAEVKKISGETPLKIKMSVVLAQGYSAPKVSEQVNSAVNSALMTALEISGIPTEIKVTEVTHAIVERERRVV